MIILQQAFYGHRAGYGLLGASDPTISGIMERLCESIGTPTTSGACRPFYINWSNGIRRFMVYGCNGKPDVQNRRTLFFHALVGKEDELRAAQIGIAALIARGAFATEFTGGPVEPLAFESKTPAVPFPPAPFRWNGENLAIVSEKPDLDLILGLLRERSDTLNWTSFTFNPDLPDFQVFILAQNTGLPSDRPSVASNGIRLASPNLRERQRPVPPPRQPKWKILLVLLFISLTANVAFATFLYFRSQSSGQPSSGTKTLTPKLERRNEVPTVPEKIPLVQQEAIRQEVLQELRQNFLRKITPEFNRPFGDCIKEQKDSAITIIWNKKGTGYPFLKAMEIYMNFVQSEIMKKTIPHGEEQK